MLGVSYKTVYRWLEKGLTPHNAQSKAIDELFKEYADLRDVVIRLKHDIKDPIAILRQNSVLRDMNC